MSTNIRTQHKIATETDQVKPKLAKYRAKPHARKEAQPARRTDTRPPEPSRARIVTATPAAPAVDFTLLQLSPALLQPWRRCVRIASSASARATTHRTRWRHGAQPRVPPFAAASSLLKLLRRLLLLQVWVVGARRRACLGRAHRCGCPRRSCAQWAFCTDLAHSACPRAVPCTCAMLDIGAIGSSVVLAVRRHDGAMHHRIRSMLLLLSLATALQANTSACRKDLDGTSVGLNAMGGQLYTAIGQRC